MTEFDGGQDGLFGLFLGARLDHHDAVLVADDHDVYRGGGALGIGWIDDKLAIHAANPDCAHGGAEGNVGESQCAGGGVDADHIGVVFLVGGEDQCNHLGLVAEAVRKERTDGAVNLAASENFLLAGPAFTLDKAAGDAPAGICVLAVIHGKWEKVDAFPGFSGGYGGGQYNGFARADQCGARGLLGHAAGLKNQPLAAGKLNGYFMLRHRVLVSFLFAWETCEGVRHRMKRCQRRAGHDAGRAQESGGCAGERILPACMPVWTAGPRSADSCAQALAAGSIRQAHFDPRSWVERGP